MVTGLGPRWDVVILLLLCYIHRVMRRGYKLSKIERIIVFLYRVVNVLCCK